MIKSSYFEGVTLLITHYNRSSSLERLLKAFKELNCQFDDIVVSDDGSQNKHLDYIENIRKIYNFKLIATVVNKGLGHNINKGQDAVKTPYTLYIQEDFVPSTSFPEHFSNALDMMRQDKTWDLISLYAYNPYPYSKPYRSGFSEKIYKPEPWYTRNLKFYLYSDHPHLRKSSFLKDFGRYREGINGDKTEMQMSFSFIKNKGKALLFDNHYDLLTQLNSEDEPSTAAFRNKWATKKNAFILFAKWIYARIKFIRLNYQLMITKPVK